ncbi:MAG: hypothetical protein WC693_02300 [Patescibacteria group bacterium]|jgi:hypothetical protein
MEEQTKTNKSYLVWVSVIIIVAIAGVVYFMMKGDEEINNNTNVSTVVTNTQISNTNTVITNTATDHIYVHNDFTIVPPAGWLESQIPGTLVSFFNTTEQHPEDSTAAKINFKSYLAVSFDTAAIGSTLDSINAKVMQEVENVVSSSEVVSVSDEMLINNLPARFSVLNMTMQEVDYRVLIVVLLDQDHQRYYTVTGNTTAEKWGEYEDAFLKSARSLTIK